MERIERAYNKGNAVAKELLISYANAEFLQSYQKFLKKLKL